jgi:subtilisin family serine protease
MKICIHFFLAISFAASFFAQQKLDHILLAEVAGVQPDEFIKIRIEFKTKAHVTEEKHRLIVSGSDVQNRAFHIIHLLRSTAETSQNAVYTFLIKNAMYVQNIQKFWISNVIFCEMRAGHITELNQFEEISGIYFENNRFELGDVFVQEEHVDVRGPGGTEPSIEACNVRPLWNLGYTGRGRKVFVYDTGVWPNHQSIGSRFMGNFGFLGAAWYGYYHNEPNGERNSHGTHVLGTMVGLDENTADSIGIAMNSYWIANDHVGQTVSVMPDLPYLMAAYEWALNPDGDINTTNDIPDVINNSFRWYDGADMTQCEGIVVDLMIAIDAVGIANIYSGGNQGPNNTTIAAPQRINVTEVNTFSVGSVNGNMPFPHPLSNFSSVGPKQCPGEGSLAIHPEVVAPGQNVRSAWGQEGYNTISGTSMAAPHVSGVALLLKEAFPYLSGEDILWALYLTAIDMGPEGEDNQFGMGMIDAYAAYLYLSENNTPVDPNNIEYDLAITAINGIEMNGVYCDNVFQPSVTIKNLGSNTINAFSLTYNWIGGTPSTITWSEPLAPLASVVVDLPVLSTSFSGQQEYWVEATILNENEYYDLINNRRHVRFNVRPRLPIPFIEEFENNWNNGLWIVNNPDASYTWRTTFAPFHHNNNQSAVIQLSNYNPAGNQRDELVSPIFTLPNTGEIVLDFDLSYRRRSAIASHQDTLYIMIQNGCTGARDTLIMMAGTDLAVTSSPIPNFVPVNNEDWKKIELNLNTYLGEEITVVIESVNRAGNHIYMDNFRIYERSSPPLQTVNFGEAEIVVFPNPTSNKFAVEIKNVQFYESAELNIINLLGQNIKSVLIQNTVQNVDVTNLSSGVYLIQVRLNNNIYTTRLVIE